MEPTCEWTLHRGVVWRTECKEEMLNEWTSHSFRFCPFCGCPLVIRDEDDLRMLGY